MSPRLRDAAEAGLVALLVGAVAAGAIVWLFDNSKSFDWTLAAAAALASGITTSSLWYLAFPRREISTRRALWVGPLAVAAAMWLMFVLWGLSQSDNVVRDTSLLAWFGKTVVVGVFFAVFGLIYVGILLLPLGALCAYGVRRYQIASRPGDEPPAT